MSQEGAAELAPPVCAACGTVLPRDCYFCPGCGRRAYALAPAETLTGGPPSGLASHRTGVPDKQTTLEWARGEVPESYEPVRLLGRGGMGVVFQCHDKNLDRSVALKLMSDRYRTDPRAERRFLAEARAQAVINHPNVAMVLDVGVSATQRPYIVMEYVEGQDLRQAIREHPMGLPPERACLLLEQACAGLSEAHGAGIIHRDMKPSNLMVARDMRGGDLVKILDLGLAKIAGGAADFRTITLDTAGLLVGTPAYMSPEQIGGTNVDARADLYALGVVFFELLTGRLPFESDTVEGWLFQHLHSTPPAPSRLRPELARCSELDGLVLWALAKAPEDRPQTAAQLSEALARVRGEWLAALRSPDAAAPPADAAMGDLPTLASGLEPLPSSVALPRVHAAPPAARPEEPAGQEAAVLKQERFAALAKAAEAAEAEGKWEEAIEHWRQAVSYAPDRNSVSARLEALKRALAFEQVLASVVTLAGVGDWVRAEAALVSAASMLPGDKRVEQARKRVPLRLAEAWLDKARAQLGHFQKPAQRDQFLRRLAVARARLGDLTGAVRWLQDESPDLELRVSGLGQAVSAAWKSGFREGLRAYLDRALALAGSLDDPGARGRAYLELGHALITCNQADAAGGALEQAVASFAGAGREHGQQGAKEPSVSRQAPRLRRGSITRFLARAAKSATETAHGSALAAVSKAQSEAGQTDAALRSADLIDDPWTRAQALSSVAQAEAQCGRLDSARRICERVNFRLLRFRALRAVAMAQIERGQLQNAEKTAGELATPEERAPVLAGLAGAYLKGADAARAKPLAQEALNQALQPPSPVARLNALMGSAEALLRQGAGGEARAFLDGAGRQVDSMEDAAERLLGLVWLANVRGQAARSAGQAGAGTQYDVFESLRRACATLRLIHTSPEREECLIRLATAVAQAHLPDLAGELLTQCTDERDRAWVCVGLAEGTLEEPTAGAGV